MKRRVHPNTSIFSHRFIVEDRAALSIEAAIMLPLLVAIYVAGYQFFDQYRRETQMTKASFAVADMLSRQSGFVTPHDLNGLEGIYETMTASVGDSFMRFTELRRRADGLDILFSYATDGQPAMTQALLQGFMNRIPRLDLNARVTLVEAYTYDEPVFNVGLRDRIIPNIVPMDHRYEAGVQFAILDEETNGNSSVSILDDGCNSVPVPINGLLLVRAGDCGEDN